MWDNQVLSRLIFRNALGHSGGGERCLRSRICHMGGGSRTLFLSHLTLGGGCKASSLTLNPGPTRTERGLQRAD